MQFITSNQNHNVQWVRNLRLRKYRESSGCFFIEGMRAVSEAAAADLTLRWLVYSQSFAASEAAAGLPEVPVLPVSDRIFATFCETETPQGIGAVVNFPEPPPPEVIRAYRNILLLEHVQDPGNMGTMIRTADAAGFDAVFCTKGCVDIYNPKVLRATVGSVFHLPILQWEDLSHRLSSENAAASYPVSNMASNTAAAAAEWLRTQGFRIYAAHPRGGDTCFETVFRDKNVIVIGNEANGLTDEMIRACDSLVTIPMPGRAESLNASVAAALLIYEVVRRGAAGRGGTPPRRHTKKG